MKNLYFGFFVFLILCLSFAADMKSSLQKICTDIYCLLPPISMLLVVAAAVTYAAGQLSSAEVRARATGWATTMVIGALFGFVLVSLFPPLLHTLYKNVDSTVTADWCTNCTTSGGGKGKGSGGGSGGLGSETDRSGGVEGGGSGKNI